MSHNVWRTPRSRPTQSCGSSNCWAISDALRPKSKIVHDGVGLASGCLAERKPALHARVNVNQRTFGPINSAAIPRLQTFHSPTFLRSFASRGTGYPPKIWPKRTGSGCSCPLPTEGQSNLRLTMHHVAERSWAYAGAVHSLPLAIVLRNLSISAASTFRLSCADSGA